MENPAIAAEMYAYAEPEEEKTQLDYLIEMNYILSNLMWHLNDDVFRQYGSKILAGPFTGMKIPTHSPWNDTNSSVKLFGLYEFEIHGAIAIALARNPTTIVNVGCSDGYYAVGFGMRCPDIKIFGMDINVDSLKMCQEYAQINGTEVTTIEGCLTPEELDVDATGHRFYLVDVENAELELLKPDRCPALVHSDLIVECHEFMIKGLTEEIERRLHATHYIARIEPQIPPLERFHFSGGVSALNFLALIEKRPLPTYWLACFAKEHSDEAMREEYRERLKPLINGQSHA